MEKITYSTDIYLTGHQAVALLLRNEVEAWQLESYTNEKGEILLASFDKDDVINRTIVGDVSISYGAVDQGENFSGNQILSHAVTIDVSNASALQGQKYRNKNREVHINKLEGVGKQKVRKGVELVVRTTFPRIIFERNAR